MKAVEPDIRRSPGRPKNDDPGATVCTWLPSREHDKLIRLANKHETSVSAIVRLLIRQQGE